MNPIERDEYLKRIGYTEEIRTDKECLEKLMESQLRSVPFENLEPFEEGRVPSLDTQDLYTKIVLHKRGGYCFELNKLFYELIKTLGFRVYPLGVRIPWNKSKLPPMLHRATLVTFEDGIYYCDIGYGGPGPKHLVKLEDGVHKEKDGQFRITMKPQDTNDEVLIERMKEGNYLPILRFSLHPALEEDFDLMNFYCAKSPDVLFTQKRVVSISTAEGSYALTGDVLTIQKADGTIESHTCKSEEVAEEWLQTYFGIRRN